MTTATKEKKDKKLNETNGNGHKTPNSKPAAEQPETLYNEEQITIMDDDLTCLANDFAKSIRQHKIWKEKLQKDRKALVAAMIEKGHKTMRLGEDKVIKHKHTDAKDDLVLQDYKPRQPRRKGGRF